MSDSVEHAGLPIVSNHPRGRVELAANKGVTRREATRRLLTGVAAAFAGPAFAAAHRVRRHLENSAVMEQADVKAAAKEWKPEFLNVSQNQTVVAIAERMVPGSSGAQVNRIIDLLLSVELPEQQRDFLSSLTALDHEAQRRFGKPFSELPSEQQDAVLLLGSEGEESQTPDESQDPDEPEPAKVPVTLRDHFENLKGWIVGSYYATEQGMRELGWTEDFYFEELPECRHGGESAHGTNNAGGNN